MGGSVMADYNGFPRTRGDRPAACLVAIAPKVVPPHSRG